MQIFSFPKIKMQFEPIFLQVLWQFLSARRSRDFGISRGAFLAAAGGEMRSNYLKNTEPVRIWQGFGSRLASLGDQIIRNFGRKFELAVFYFGERKNLQINS